MGLAAISVVLALPASATSGTKDQSGTAVASCVNSVTGQNEGTFTYNGVQVAWPPNHKYREATVTLTDDDNDPLNDVTVAVSGSHNQIGENGKELVGSGHTDSTTDTLPGAGSGSDGSASAVFFFRGERSGTEQAGRTYEFTATGTTDNGLTECKPVKFTAFVPHDQGH